MSKGNTIVLLIVAFFAGATGWPFVVSICNRNLQTSAVAIASSDIEFGDEFTSDLIIVTQEQIDNGWSAPSNAVGVSYSDIVVDEPTVAEPPVWGKGELPADHQDFFGDGNDSRLNYVQNKVLDKHAEILKILAIRVLALEAIDPNAMRLEALESGMEKLTLVETVE